MEATIEQRGEDMVCRLRESTVPELRIDGAESIGRLQAWAARYDCAVRHDKDLELAEIGREMLGWLDANGWASAWSESLQGSRSLRIRVDYPDAPLSQALLDAPWELLADGRGFFADDEAQWFDVARRIGKEGEPLAPRHSDLHVLFMAAAPEDTSVLDFEAEEAAIVEATTNLKMQLVVEESGAAPLLTERLGKDGPFEALHSSCHGSIDTQHGPYLVLEDEAGERAQAFVADLVQCLGDAQQRPPLVFLSACRAAEQQASATRTGESFVRALVRGGVANVLVYERLGDVRSKALTQGQIADILQARGELDEALRIRVEEELPVYERLGDVHSKAVTQGQVADILQARGQLDEALVLHEQRLPVFQQLRDIDGIAHTKYSMAAIRLGRGDHQSIGWQQIVEDLAESFTINVNLQRPGGIAPVGQLLAQVLSARGLKEEALRVLDVVEPAFDKLGHAQGVEHVRQLRATIENQAPANHEPGHDATVS